MITLFENYRKKPDLNSVSPEFWKMVKIANWNVVMKGYKNNPIVRQDRLDFYKKAQNRIYSKYTFKEIEKFNGEYHVIYTQVYDFFSNIWLDDKYASITVSDDGYSDLISSVVGKGKTWVDKSINNVENFVQMMKNRDYVENFGYLFQVDEDEYNQILDEFATPLQRKIKKYNL